MDEKEDINIFRIRLKTRPVQIGEMKQSEVFEYCKEKNIIGLGWEIPEKFKSKKLKIEDAMNTRQGTNDEGYFKKNMKVLSEIRKDDIVWARTEEGIYYIGKILNDEYKCWDAWGENREEADKFDIRNVKECKFYRVGGIEKVPGIIINSFSGPGHTIKRVGGKDKVELQRKIRIICKMIFNEVCDNDSEKFQIKDEESLDFWKIINDQDAEEIVSLYLQIKENYKVYINTKRRDTPKYEFIMVDIEGRKAAVQVKTGNNVTLKVKYYENDKDYGKIYLFSVNEDTSEYKNSNDKVTVLRKDEDVEKFLIDYNKILPDYIRKIMLLCDLITE